MKKFLFLLLFCLLNNFSMEAPKRTIADIFELNKEAQNSRKQDLTELLMTILRSSTSTETNKLITSRLGRFMHPDKVQNEYKEVATELFKLFQDLKHDSAKNNDPDFEKRPWLIKVPSEVKEIFVHRFFELLETNITYKGFKDQLDIIVTLSYTKDANNRFILDTYNNQPINTIVDNGLNIINKSKFDELKDILCLNCPNFETVFNDFISTEQSIKYAYLFDLLTGFQTFDRSATSVKPEEKAAYWFEKYATYKTELYNNRHDDNYNFEKSDIDQKRVAAAVMLSACDIDYQRAFSSDKNEFKLIEKAIQNWSNKQDSLEKTGYHTFKSYQKNYHDLCNDLQAKLEEPESTDKQKKRLKKDLLNFVDALLTIEHETAFNKENTCNACLFCLNNRIPFDKVLPKKNSRDEELWNKNISSFSSFIMQFNDYQNNYPLLLASEELVEVKTQIFLRFIELQKRNSCNSNVFNDFFKDPLFSINKIAIIDNYLFRFNLTDRSFLDYINSIKKLSKKYIYFQTNLLKDYKTLSDFAVIEDRVLQVIPHHSKNLFKNFMADIVTELKPSGPLDSNSASKISLLKILLESYLIPFNIETKQISCIPKQLSFEILQKTIDTIKEKLIQENWFQSAQNPELINITAKWVDSSIRAAFLNIEPQSFDEIKNNTIDNEVQNNKLITHLDYFAHYTNFVTHYYLIVPHNMVLKSFDEWLNASKVKSHLAKTTSSLPSSQGWNGELPKNNISLLDPIVRLLQANNPTFAVNGVDIGTQIETEAQKQLHASWKFKIQQVTQLAIETGLLKFFCESLGSNLARNFIPHLKQAKDDIYYQQAYEHYKVNAIKNPKKRAYMEDRLKTEYNQYSHQDFLHKAIRAAGPYMTHAQLKKTLHYF